MRKFLISSLVGGAAVVGILVGTGHADAKIESGHYKSRVLLYGFVPMPESNVHVVGNKMYEDVFGFGPKNVYTYNIEHTKNGGITYSSTPNGRWAGATEYKKTRYGYKGDTRGAGGAVPLGGAEMRRVR